MSETLREALDEILQFLDELTANGELRKAQNPILLGGCAKFYATRLRAALAAPQADGAAVQLVYTNYRGETSLRTIVPKSIRYGATEWHPEPQWLLLALDLDKNADREFALKDFGPATPPADVREDVIRCLYETAPSFSYDECAKMADALISSALVAPDTTAAAAPQADAEPVAWRMRLVAEDHEPCDWSYYNHEPSRHRRYEVEPLYTAPPSQAADRMRDQINFYRRMSDAAVYSGPNVANILDTMFDLSRKKSDDLCHCSWGCVEADNCRRREARKQAEESPPVRPSDPAPPDRGAIARIIDPRAFIIVNSKRADIQNRQELALGTADRIIALRGGE